MLALCERIAGLKDGRQNSEFFVCFCHYCRIGQPANSGSNHSFLRGVVINSILRKIRFNKPQKQIIAVSADKSMADGKYRLLYVTGFSSFGAIWSQDRSKAIVFESEADAIAALVNQTDRPLIFIDLADASIDQKILDKFNSTRLISCRTSFNCH